MQTGISAIPPSILDAAAALLKPYGVDIVAVLSRERDGGAPAVEPLRKKYLTSAEAELYSGLGRWSLWNAERNGIIKASKMADARSGKVIYDRASIDAWLESRRKQPRTEMEE